MLCRRRARVATLKVTQEPTLLAHPIGEAQDIFIPFAGERGIEMVRDVAAKELTSRAGEPCGEYFLFEGIGDQKVLSFKVPVTKKEERLAVLSFVRIDRSLVVVELDDAMRVPTAEWYRAGPASDEHWRIRLRLSSRDFEAAGCLPRPGT
jgi:hypothetical protein